jgi:hypothetical protein
MCIYIFIKRYRDRMGGQAQEEERKRDWRGCKLSMPTSSSVLASL